MLGQRLRRWSKIKTTLIKRPVLAGIIFTVPYNCTVSCVIPTTRDPDDHGDAHAAKKTYGALTLMPLRTTIGTIVVSSPFF